MVLRRGGKLVLKMGRGVPPYRKLTLAEAFDIATIPNALGRSSKREQRGGFMGCRRCRRPIVGSYEWGAGESLEILRAYCPTLSWHEVGMNGFELGLNFMWGSN